MESSKRLVSVLVPAIGERFDLFIPLDMEIGMLTDLIANAIQELTNGDFCKSDSHVLTLKDPNILLQPQKTTLDYGIEDGAQFVLF